mmetsp:Transcript_821/g.1118  ORF Transcript_821/g.1118 Transcript_821/m.1118 type:complete len:267 (-) Transcript_821:2697-3497(-)
MLIASSYASSSSSLPASCTSILALRFNDFAFAFFSMYSHTANASISLSWRISMALASSGIVCVSSGGIGSKVISSVSSSVSPSSSLLTSSMVGLWATGFTEKKVSKPALTSVKGLGGSNCFSSDCLPFISTSSGSSCNSNKDSILFFCLALDSSDFSKVGTGSSDSPKISSKRPAAASLGLPILSEGGSLVRFPETETGSSLSFGDISSSFVLFGSRFRDSSNSCSRETLISPALKSPNFSLKIPPNSPRSIPLDFSSSTFLSSSF